MVNKKRLLFLWWNPFSQLFFEISVSFRQLECGNSFLSAYYMPIPWLVPSKDYKAFGFLLQRTLTETLSSELKT